MSNITVDSSQLTKLFDNLSQENQKQMMMKALKKGADYLKQKTQQTLSSKFPKAKEAKGKAKKTMIEGVYVKPKKDFTEVDVSVMGNYLNVFFEGGTVDRYRKIRYKDNKGKTRISKTSKGGYTGKIDALNFFQDTRQRESDNVIGKIEDELKKQLDKLNK